MLEGSSGGKWAARIKNEVSIYCNFSCNICCINYCIAAVKAAAFCCISYCIAAVKAAAFCCISYCIAAVKAAAFCCVTGLPVLSGGKRATRIKNEVSIRLY